MTDWLTYVLVDPRTRDPLYVGKTRDINKRLHHHMSGRTTGYGGVFQRKRSEIYAAGGNIGVCVIAGDVEKQLVHSLIMIGFDLPQQHYTVNARRSLAGVEQPKWSKSESWSFIDSLGFGL